MSEIKIIYWSQTGNTEIMAGAVEKGVRAAGKEAKTLAVGELSASELKGDTVFALGCPAMGAEELEESEMEPFVQELEGFVSGKKLALFGSYGWGGGQWMRDWEDRMKAAGAELLGGEGVICNETPDDEALAACEELGKLLAEV